MGPLTRARRVLLLPLFGGILYRRFAKNELDRPCLDRQWRSNVIKWSEILRTLSEIKLCQQKTMEFEIRSLQWWWEPLADAIFGLTCVRSLSLVVISSPGAFRCFSFLLFNIAIKNWGYLAVAEHVKIAERLQIQWGAVSDLKGKMVGKLWNCRWVTIHKPRAHSLPRCPGC